MLIRRKFWLYLKIYFSLILYNLNILSRNYNKMVNSSTCVKHFNYYYGSMVQIETLKLKTQTRASRAKMYQHPWTMFNWVYANWFKHHRYKKKMYYDSTPFYTHSIQQEAFVADSLKRVGVCSLTLTL